MWKSFSYTFCKLFDICIPLFDSRWLLQLPLSSLCLWTLLCLKFFSFHTKSVNKTSVETSCITAPCFSTMIFYKYFSCVITNLKFAFLSLIPIYIMVPYFSPLVCRAVNLPRWLKKIGGVASSKLVTHNYENSRAQKNHFSYTKADLKRFM